MFATVISGVVRYTRVRKIAIFDQYLPLSQKGYKMANVRWKRNRNSYAVYRMVPSVMTVSHRGLHFEVTIFFDYR